MTAFITNPFGVVLIAVFVIAAVVCVVRVVTRVRLHRPLANRRFMRRYRAEHPLSSQATVEASPSRWCFQ